jgi:hypothetical protein
MSNWKPEVLVNGKWSCNAVVFASEEEAIISARDLMSRWTLVMDYRAVPSNDPVNYVIVNTDDGQLHMKEVKP